MVRLLRCPWRWVVGLTLHKELIQYATIETKQNIFFVDDYIERKDQLTSGGL